MVRKVKTIADLPCQGKRVFVRVDFNVPLDDRGNVCDDSRIVATLPTIRHLMMNGAKVILASHLGRPNGEKIAKYSLRNVAPVLAKYLEQPVQFLSDCIGEEVSKAVEKMSNCSVALLENLRFYREETDNNPKFAKKLADLADIYVNDAFGTAHRAHASTEGITKFVKRSVAGFLMERELEFLGNRVANPRRPFVVILGGAKVSDKIKVINSLLEKADSMLIGGAMAYTFLAASGNTTGASRVERGEIHIAQGAMDKAREMSVPLLLPVDHVVTQTFDAEKMTIGDTAISAVNIDGGQIGVDIGPQTVEFFKKEIESAGTVLWNGPMGIFEIERAAAGTFAIASAVAKSDAISIIGGGDSVRAIKASGYAEDVSFISTGGGASLEFLEGAPLPGVEALEKLQ
ncbi:MAG: phosphoglycerate kinase [Puniceicoccales bacterium]|jgi:3-phosphoglycerate kinase|nr:phosphoglycerate kinase [Puniceicoccales bacterium]